MNLWKASKRAHECAKAHGFWSGVDTESSFPWGSTDVHVINTSLLLIASEVYEAMEEHRASDRLDRFDAFGDELADVLIRVADLAGYLNIDLETRVKAKMAANEMRPPMHGGKQF